jgi:serine/threonine-protein kinase
MIGTLLKDRYRIDAKLGEGGMGVVYKAHDRLLDRPVAIKTLTPALLLVEERARRFLREAQSAARLNHPHIVSTYDALEDRGSFAIVMELVEGKTLRESLPISLDRPSRSRFRSSRGSSTRTPRASSTAISSPRTL